MKLSVDFKFYFFDYGKDFEKYLKNKNDDLIENGLKRLENLIDSYFIVKNQLNDFEEVNEFINRLDK